MEPPQIEHHVVALIEQVVSPVIHLFRKLRAGTKSPQFAAFLDQQLERLTTAQQSDQWVDRYNAAIAEVRAGHLGQAETMFQDVPEVRAKQGARATR